MAAAPRQTDRSASNADPATISSRTLGIVIAIGVISLGASIVISVLGDPARVSNENDTGSFASIGHRALIELLESLEIPVLVSRFESAGRSRDRALLVLAEPEGETPDSTQLGDILDESTLTLVVLPEWRATPHPEEKRWTGPLVRSDTRLRIVLEAINANLEVTRTRDGAPDETWTYHDLGRVSIAADCRVRPFADPDVQLLRPSAALEPIIECSTGVLLARVTEPWARSGELYVLADPTSFSNRGLAQPGQAALAVGILDALRPRDGVIVFDETLHGELVIPSPYAALFRFPLVLALFQTLAIGAAAVAVAARRFGSPRAEESSIAKTPGYSIRNTAEWLDVAGHSAPLLTRYLDTILRRVAAGLSYRGSNDRADLAEFLDRTAERRGLDERVAHLELEIELAQVKRAQRDHATRILAAAHRIHRYQETMLDGARRGTPRR